MVAEKAMAPHSSTLAWKIPWTEEPGGLQFTGSLRVGHDWVTSLSLSCIGEGNGNPLQCSCLENLRDGGTWWAAVSGVTQSRTRLKRLSSSSSRGLVKYMSVSWNARDPDAGSAQDQGQVGCGVRPVVSFTTLCSQSPIAELDLVQSGPSIISEKV